jgi:hypothetical protein
MSGQPEENTSPEELNEEGAGLGMGEDDNTFEPEEDPDAVDDPDDHLGPGGTLSYEEEASAALEAAGDEPPRQLTHDEEALVQELYPVPDEQREVEVVEDDDDDVL